MKKSVYQMPDSIMACHESELNGITSFRFMLCNGKGYVRLYIYNDDRKHAYIEGLSVEIGERCKSIGTTLMNACEGTAFNMGVEKVLLRCEGSSPYWLYDWYKRRGYKRLPVTMLSPTECDGENDWMEINMSEHE